ncbi:MAG: 1-(5-phosphoribosyl)-5-[(5-phosphoribosylamino)methylideneamino]imidazole-4-carboxamide isomerase [Elusimicrobia bacterium]|nr:1-(5-phosphoribosyl)-5-[(5-phosphoribosylamino)methylideneamino]imidazole-4-carboxamide isomerase [Elusimicrobiota bacterium]
MIIFPAIDIKDGKVVRLRQGRFDDITEYWDDPLEVAGRWIDAGAKALHLVDLDGAETGTRSNQDAIKRIARSVKVPVQCGGGIRTLEAIDDFLNAGVARVILGTRVVLDRDFFRGIIKGREDRLVVSLDCSKGLVTQRGWVEVSTLPGVDLARELERMGLKYLVYTDVARDGMLSGPNIEELKKVLSAVRIHVIASGGIKDLKDVQALKALKAPNLLGVITGRALYEGTLKLKDAIRMAEGC